MTRARDLGDFIADGAAAELVVDTTTLVVDSTNNRVGIGTASPSQALEVTGTVTSTGLASTTAGTSNFRAGVNAGNSIASGGNYNVVVGDEAGTAITTGDANVAIGYAALDALDTGINNTTVGWSSGGALTQGTRNTAIGYASLDADTLGSKSTALGYSALGVQNFTTATDSFNVAVGHEAGAAVTTGVENTLIGGLTGDSITTGNENTALGKSAMSANTNGRRNTALGHSSLAAYNHTTATNAYNTTVGYNSGASVTTGVDNTFIGALTGDATDDANECTAVGRSALGNGNCGNNNTAFGYGALSDVTGTHNAGLGHNAGGAITSGSKNVIVGSYDGNENGLDIRTSSNNIVLSDGDGNPRVAIGSAGQLGIAGANYGTSGQVLQSGGASAAPTWADVGGGGKVLQVVTGSYTGYTNINSNSFTDIPLSVNITLTSSSNRVMVWAMGGTLEAGVSSTGGMYARLIRKIGSGSDTTLSEGNAQQTANKSSINQGTVLALGGGDAPATSSAVTYKVQVKSDNGNTINVNYYGGGDMTIIAMEIAV